MKVMALYAATHRLESMIVFQTQYFFLYNQSEPDDGPEFSKKVGDAILHKSISSRSFRCCGNCCNYSLSDKTV